MSGQMIICNSEGKFIHSDCSGLSIQSVRKIFSLRASVQEADSGNRGDSLRFLLTKRREK